MYDKNNSSCILQCFYYLLHNNENVKDNNEGVENKITVAYNDEQDGSIAGEWKLVLVTEDKNGNGELDPDERSNAITTMQDYMKLNRDGTCVFYIFETKDCYEINTNPGSGKKYPDLFNRTNTRHSKGAIVSVTKDELIIMNKFSGDSFTIWKRM